MKYTYLVVALLFVAVLACKKDEDENTYVPQTPEQDDAQIIAYATDSLGLDEESLIELESGVYISYILDDEGNRYGIGDEVENDTTNIEVYYSGYYIPAGSPFETTQPGNPRVFNLSNNISGWKIALKAMRRNERAHIFIPSREAYSNGNRHFTITLEGFTLATDGRDDYEESLIQDYFDTNDISNAELISDNDSANVYLKHLTEGSGNYPSLTDSVVFSYKGANIVTGIEKHVSDDSENLLESIRYGMQSGLLGMKKGGTANIYVPSKYNATTVDVLEYEVTLDDIIVNEE